uniref:Solute carrier family 35 member E4-like n=1 Tax=Geotrypetes seraphini TaxID=260995 RepID=A0A6P8P379_GEOSA|nr:solute carrier family 35 member E4-like [Geotrypetes seraphini]
MELVEITTPAEPGTGVASSWRWLPVVVSGTTLVLSGVGIASLNKWVFVGCAFPFPLFLSALHMLSAILFNAALLRLGLVCGRPGSPPPLRALPLAAKRRVFLLSLTFCASIAFGNLALRHAEIAFAQVLYAASPLVTMLLSQLLQRRAYAAMEYAAMLPVCLGASLSVLGELRFNQIGCIFICITMVLRSVKSIQQGVLLQEENIDTILLLFIMSLPSFLLLLSCTLLFESRAFWELLTQGTARLWMSLLLSCSSSVLYNLSGFYVVKHTSAVTLHLLGNLVVLGNVLTSQAVFGGPVSKLGVAGTVLTLIGVLVYQNSDAVTHLVILWKARWRR